MNGRRRSIYTRPQQAATMIFYAAMWLLLALITLYGALVAWTAWPR